MDNYITRAESVKRYCVLGVNSVMSDRKCVGSSCMAWVPKPVYEEQRQDTNALAPNVRDLVHREVRVSRVVGVDNDYGRCGLVK